MKGRPATKYADRTAYDKIKEHGGIVAFAKKFGCTTDTVYKWYEQPRRMTIETAEKLLEFGIEWTDFEGSV